MPFISFAPNCEDVPLWRALHDVALGQYLDWGAEPAGGASITRAFYDRGWSGASVRPTSAEAASLAALRPRDTVLTVAEPLQLQGALHFLRADGAALRSLDLAALRPWIAIVPAADAAAEEILGHAGYQRILFDGLSWFHLAPEHDELASRLAAPANASDDFVRLQDADAAARLAALQAALDSAEARIEGSRERSIAALRSLGHARADRVNDHTARAEEAAWLRGLAEAAAASEAKLRTSVDWWRDQNERRMAELAARAAESAWLRGNLQESEFRVARLNEQLRALDEQVRALGEQVQQANAEAQAARTQAGVLQSSLSWRVTAPLRRVRSLAGPAPRGSPPPAAEPAPALQAAAPVLAVTAPPTAPPTAAPPPTPPARPPLPPMPHPAAPPPEPVVAAEGPSRDAAGPARPEAPLRTVHQFHAGSARGDAITNAMLLIRTQLRAAGFRSDIFVETRGEGLEHELQLMDALPDHAEYVLLLHHSTGFPSYEAVLALPVPKVLVYHNITPPAFFGDVPGFQRQARRGREQLAGLRDHVRFALADSTFNGFELHRLGFAAVRTCTLLFDTADMARQAAGLRASDGVFTVLFVGRITPSKAQDDLLEAFAVFRERFGRPSRLVLIGRTDPDQSRYLDRLMDRIGALALTDSVQLTGLVSDEELHGWYRQADLYVSLSHHEGFGVPLVEALAHSVPVLAWPAGAVPFTLGGAGTLLASRAPGAVAEAMVAAAASARLPTAAALGRWALDRQMPVLLDALAAAGASAPVGAATRALAAARLCVTVTGHVAKSYSLAAINRAVAATLEAQRPGSVRIRPVEGAPTDDLAEVPDADRPLVARLAARPAAETGPELVLSGHYPVHVPTERGDVTAALFFWEETLVPAATVDTLNRGFDAVVAPSRFVAKALVDSGVSAPVLNLGLAPLLDAFAALADARERSGPFTFLHVSSAFPRKGLDVLLAAWARAFTAADPVRLVVKTFPNPHNEAAALCARLRADHPNAAPVTLVDEDLPADALLALYRDADAAVLPSRGEGYNLPAAEAMAAGLPLIVTAWGGHLDFCGPDNARLVRCRVAPSASHLASPHALWAEPDAADLTAALREAAAGSLTGLTGPARAAIAAASDPAAFTARLADAAAAVLLAPPPRPLRLAWVSSWAAPCGIAEYSRHLLDALPRDGMADPVILCDDRTAAAPNVRPSWRAGDADSADRLAAAIARADGDVTVVQHQPGLLPWAGLARLLDQLADAGRVVVVTLHNTRDLADTAPGDRAVAVRALGRVARILVHTLADLHELDAHGVAASATLLAHPAPPPGVAALRPLPPDAAPVIGCTGFFLPDKGIAQLIAATVRLRQRWPGVRLRLVNAEYDDPISAAAIAECRALAAAEDLPVEWHTGFLATDAQRALLAGCDLLVLPYQRSKEGSSAALRTALATGIPVAVTPLPLFAEAAGAVFRLPGLDAAALELGMASLLSQPERRAALAADARAWLADRATPDIARRLGGMLAGLAAQHRLGAPLDGSLWPAPQPGGGGAQRGGDPPGG